MTTCQNLHCLEEPIQLIFSHQIFESDTAWSLGAETLPTILVSLNTNIDAQTIFLIVQRRQ